MKVWFIILTYSVKKGPTPNSDLQLVALQYQVF